jgi:hypothetical protein
MSASLYFVSKNVSFTFTLHLSAILVYNDNVFSPFDEVKRARVCNLTSVFCSNFLNSEVIHERCKI